MLITAIITLIAALALSAVAAYVSVTGMMALFAGVASTMMFIMIILEASKLVAANWLHVNWKNPNVTKKHRFLMTAMVIVLMLVTSMGIYGFLSKGYLEQKAPVAGIELQIAQKEQSIKMLVTENERLGVKMAQLDKNIDAFLNGNKAERANTIRNRQKAERNEIDKQIQDNNKKIQKLNDEILPLKVSTSEVEAKLGPIKYVAELFGWKDPSAAVRLVMLMLVFSFDPLAVLLLLGATISFSDWKANKNKPIDTPEQPVFDDQDPFEAPQPNQGVDVHSLDPTSQIAQNPYLVETPDNELTIDPTASKVGAPPETIVFKPVEDEVKVETEKKKRGGNRRKKVDKQADDIAYKGEVKRLAQSYLNNESFVDDGSTSIPVDEKKKFIEILEKHPGLLNDLIDVIRDDDKPKVQEGEEKIDEDRVAEKPQPSTWLDAPQKPKKQ